MFFKQLSSLYAALGFRTADADLDLIAALHLALGVIAALHAALGLMLIQYNILAESRLFIWRQSSNDINNYI